MRTDQAAPGETGPGPTEPSGLCAYVTATVADQLVGIPIERVHDVFVTAGITPVPLAAPDVAGLVNLRGRVITAIDLRVRLGFPRGESAERRIAVGIEAGGDSFGLLVDGIGEVLQLPASSREEKPVHLVGPWAELTRALHRIDGNLLMVVDVDAVLLHPPAAAAAA